MYLSALNRKAQILLSSTLIVVLACVALLAIPQDAMAEEQEGPGCYTETEIRHVRIGGTCYLWVEAWARWFQGVWYQEQSRECTTCSGSTSCSGWVLVRSYCRVA